MCVCEYIHMHLFYIHINTFYISIFNMHILIDGPSILSSQRGEKEDVVGVGCNHYICTLCDRQFVWMPVCVVCVQIHIQPHCCSDLALWNCSRFTSLKLLACYNAHQKYCLLDPNPKNVSQQKISEHI